jgi:hypothetical protein
MMLVGALVPLLELFDRWDPPGLSNDTEYAFYAFIVAICLVLLLSRLISSGALRFSLISSPAHFHSSRAKSNRNAPAFLLVTPPLSALPLRI